MKELLSDDPAVRDAATAILDAAVHDAAILDAAVRDAATALLVDPAQVRLAAVQTESYQFA